MRQPDGRAAGYAALVAHTRMAPAMRFSKTTSWTGCALVRAAVLMSGVLFGAATATAASTGCTSVNNGTFNAAFTPGRSPGCSGNTCTTSNVAGLTFVPGDTINYSLANSPAQADVQWTLVLGGDISAQAAVPPPNNLSGSIIIRTVQASGGTYASYTYSNSTQFSGTYTCTAGPPAPQTLSFTSTAPTNAVVGGPTYTPTATSTSGLTLALTIDAASSAVCSISGGGAVSFQAAGTCIIDANQAGDQNFAAATQVQQSFAVTAPPTVTSIAPTSGPATGGTIVTITGTSFSGATAVAFGSAGAVWFDVKSATSIIAKAPPGNGAVDVRVTSSAGTSATSAADLFTYTQMLSANYVDPERGADSGQCPQTAPCATLNYALSQAPSGGTINIVRGGTFGPIYIAQPIIINGPADGSAAIAWSSAQPGCVGGLAGSCNGNANANYAVEIAATESSAVQLNNLVIDNGAGTNGAMRVASASSVSLSGSVLNGGTGAIGQMVLVDTSQGAMMELFFANCDVGFSTSGGGIFVAPGGATPVYVSFEGGEVHDGMFGLKFDASALSPGSGIEASIDRTELFSFTNSGVTAKSTGDGSANVLLARSTIQNTGSSAFNVFGANAVGQLFKDTVTGNAVGVAVGGGATAYSHGNNEIFGNSTNVTGSLTSQAVQ